MIPNDVAERARRTVSFIAEPELAEAIEQAAGDLLLSPAEFVRLHLARTLPLNQRKNHYAQNV